jgi:hypothetical protein
VHKPKNNIDQQITFIRDMGISLFNLHVYLSSVQLYIYTSNNGERKKINMNLGDKRDLYPNK